jgi:adenine-specific DNA-methyltransferase
MDKVANTASVYGAFLKSFKSSAKEKIKLSPIHICNNNTLRNNKVFNNDINSDKILNQTYDIAYLDPPYNQRQYSANYHPLNYIANYDSSLEIYGKTGLLKISNKSKYSQKSNAFDTLKHLITNLNAKHILLSYNNEGIIEFNKIKELLISQGKVILYKKLYKKFKSNEIQENENVYEYLFHLEKINNNSTYDELIV